MTRSTHRVPENFGHQFRVSWNELASNGVKQHSLLTMARNLLAKSIISSILLLAGTHGGRDYESEVVERAFDEISGELGLFSV